MHTELPMHERMILGEAIKAASERFTLNVEGLHGPRHWQRVAANGRKLLEQEQHGDPLLIELFAWLHDCCRDDDNEDPEHGLRAAQFLETIPALNALSDERFITLHDAILKHNGGLPCEAGTATAKICWDADRLDLPRVGVMPCAKLLCTETGRQLAAQMRKEVTSNVY